MPGPGIPGAPVQQPPPHLAQHQWAQQQHYSPQYAPTQAQANPTSRPMLRTFVLAAVVIMGSLLSMLGFALLFGFSYGITATLFAIVFALLPLFWVLPIFVWLDRFEAEPWRYLVTAFLYGALGSTAGALLVNTLAGGYIAGRTDPATAMTISAAVVAPLSEETFKGLFLLVVVLFRRRRFNGITDGIVYAGIVATGFAFTENILYLARSLTEGGAVQFAVTFGLRGILNCFLHPIFTTMTGIGVGMAVASRSWAVKIIAPFLGWCAGVLLHGLWNLVAPSGAVGLLTAQVTGFFVFVAFVAFVVWVRMREARIISEYLQPYSDTGWLSPGEVRMLSSMSQRRQARSWAKLNRGPASLRSMRAFQDSASELALLRARMHHHSVDDQALRTERVLLDSMTARRREFAGMSLG